MSSLPLYRKSEMTKTTIIDDNYTSSLKICMAAAINNMRYCHDLNAMHANVSQYVLSFSCIIIIRNFVVVISHLKICLATAYIQSKWHARLHSKQYGYSTALLFYWPVAVGWGQHCTGGGDPQSQCCRHHMPASEELLHPSSRTHFC